MRLEGVEIAYRLIVSVFLMVAAVSICIIIKNDVTEAVEIEAEKAAEIEAEKERQIEAYETAQDEYTVYLNGEEVDPTNIDIRLYNYDISDEEKVVRLAPKTEVKTANRPVPMFVPVFH